MLTLTSLVKLTSKPCLVSRATKNLLGVVQTLTQIQMLAECYDAIGQQNTCGAPTSATPLCLSKVMFCCSDSLSFFEWFLVPLIFAFTSLPWTGLCAMRMLADCEWPPLFCFLYLYHRSPCSLSQLRGSFNIDMTDFGQSLLSLL